MTGMSQESQNGGGPAGAGQLVRIGDTGPSPGDGEAARSLEEAVESCSTASDSLRAASDSLRAAARSVHAAGESFRAASSLRVVMSVRTTLQIGSAWGRASSGLLLPPPPGPLSGGRRRRRRLWGRLLRGRGAGTTEWGYVDRRRGPVDRRHSPRPGQPSGGGGRRGRGEEGRRGARRALGALSGVLMVLGVLALADAAVTMLWQEPVSAIYASIQQEDLSASLATLERAAPSPEVAARLAAAREQDQRISLLAGQLERSAREGSAVGRLRIPRIGADFALVKGTATADLEKGPGVYSRSEYPQISFPGQGGVTAIAGHRTTFLAPFRHIDELRPGDRIILRMPYGRFAYTVSRRFTVRPGDVRAAVRPGAGTQLVLSSCNPPFSAAERMLVYARLSSATPLGAALAPVQRAGRGAASGALISGLGPAAEGLAPGI
jgi:sortase A